MHEVKTQISLDMSIESDQKCIHHAKYEFLISTLSLIFFVLLLFVLFFVLVVVVCLMLFCVFVCFFLFVCLSVCVSCVTGAANPLIRLSGVFAQRA